MFRTRTLARLVIPVLVATMGQALLADEPVGTTPQATSIREWKSKPTATPADAAATPLARSIHEWKSTPIAKPAASAAATPAVNTTAANTAATPAVSAGVPKSPITISLTSTLREGTLVVALDDVPIFNEKFRRPALLISQTTTWDPLQVPAGEHRLSATVYGTKKTYFSSLYDLHVSRTKGSALRFVMQGDKLIVQVAS